MKSRWVWWKPRTTADAIILYILQNDIIGLNTNKNMPKEFKDQNS